MPAGPETIADIDIQLKAETAFIADRRKRIERSTSITAIDVMMAEVAKAWERVDMLLDRRSWLARRPVVNEATVALAG